MLPKNPATLRRLVAEAVARLPAPTSSGRPRTGDIYALQETAQQGLEWVVVENDRQARQAVVVPADTWGVAGSHDLHLSAAGPTSAASGPPTATGAADGGGRPDIGPLTLRCAWPVTVSWRLLPPARRSGRLPPSDRELMAAEYRRFSEGSPVVSETRREVDASTEYEDWSRQTLQSAHRLLSAAASRPERRTSRGRGWPRRALSLAAALLLAVMTGITGYLAGKVRPASQMATFLLNRDEPVRSTSEIYPVPAEARWIQLLVPDAVCSEPRLEVRRSASGELVFADRPARLGNESSVLTFFLPATAVESATAYELSLLERCGEQREVTATYRIQFRQARP